MSGEIKLGRIGNLTVSAKPSALISTLLVWLLFSAFWDCRAWHIVSQSILGRSDRMRLLHVAADILHQVGPCLGCAANWLPMNRHPNVGPAQRLRVPPDEPALPATVHIRRALGGPMGSLLASILAQFSSSCCLIGMVGRAGLALFFLPG